MNQTCEICYQTIADADNKYFCNSCGQDYHQSCIETGTAENNACPMCKSPFFAKKRDLERDATVNPSNDHNRGEEGVGITQQKFEQKRETSEKKNTKLASEKTKRKEQEDMIALSVAIVIMLIGIILRLPLLWGISFFFLLLVLSSMPTRSLGKKKNE